MKRPVLGSVLILGLLGAGVYFAYEYANDKSLTPSVDDPGARTVGPAARLRIQEQLQVQVPPGAQNVFCDLEQVDRARVLFASFDCPKDDVPLVLGDGGFLPKDSELTSDSTLLGNIISTGEPFRRWWWKPSQLRNVRVGRKSGKRNAEPAVLKWEVKLCVGELNDAKPTSGGRITVFIVMTEEPGEK